MGSNPTGGMDVCCVCSVLSGRGLCDEMIARPEESYRPWRVVVCDQEPSCYKEAIARAGLQIQRNKQTNLLLTSVLYVFVFLCDINVFIQ
jgi:hypothetical protein